MPRSCLTLVSLLAVLTAARALAQTAEEFGTQRPPSVDEQPQAPPFQAPNATGDEIVVTDGPFLLDGSAELTPEPSLRDFLGYRYSSSSLDWIPGGGDQFGMFSIAWDHYVKSGIGAGIGTGMGFHFLAGPKQTDMPPRVFDFSIGGQIRDRMGPLGFDVAAAVRASSDFEGSARRGVRFPGHAVGFLSTGPEIDMVFGVDYLDRDDVRILPVAGLIWMPTPEMRFEIVFPRPRAVFQLTERHRLYLSGELGGGTWAVRRVALGNDLATYRDLRACIGLECVHKENVRSAFEIGYLFDRRLEYSSGVGDMRLDDAIVLRLVTRY